MFLQSSDDLVRFVSSPTIVLYVKRNKSLFWMELLNWEKVSAPGGIIFWFVWQSTEVTGVHSISFVLFIARGGPLLSSSVISLLLLMPK